jgi:NTE family protein
MASEGSAYVESHVGEGLDRSRPLSLVLGAGGVRGMAHVGVLEVLRERGFRPTEIVGTSVGGLILAFYAAVGLDEVELRALGTALSSRQLLVWALSRRLPEPLASRVSRGAGIVPGSLDRLGRASWETLHHGVERIGLVAFDLFARREMLFHSARPSIPLEDATRGAAAIPGIFPPRRCRLDGRTAALVDGGVTNHLPVDTLFAGPFRPEQVLAVDVSSTERQRALNLAKLEALRRRYPHVPIHVVKPATIGYATVLYRSAVGPELVDSGRRAAAAALGSE